MRSVTKVIASLAAIALAANSTVAVAAAPTPQTPEVTSAWMTLSLLSPTRAVALGGAVAAAQPTDVPPPPPPAYVTGTTHVGAEVIAFGVMFALIVIALATSDNGGRPNSPG